MESNFIKIDLNTLSIHELRQLKTIFSRNELYSAHLDIITNKIKEIEQNDTIIKSIYEKVDFNTYEIISKREKDILDLNGITNFQQLREANLSSLKDETGLNIGPITKEYLNWARNFYSISLVNGNNAKILKNNRIKKLLNN